MDAKVRELLTKAKDTAVGAGRSAGKAASQLVSQAKRNFRIMELNSEIESSYKNLGKMLYAVHNGVEIPADSIDEALMEIDAKKEEIDALRETIQKAKSEGVCPVCGKYVGKKAAFCSACGAKLERDAEEQPCDYCGEEEDCCCGEEAEGVCEDACCCADTAQDACDEAADACSAAEEATKYE